MKKIDIYYDLVYHLVWGTKNRLPLLTPAMEEKLFPFFKNKCADLGCVLHAVNGTTDHIHLLISSPPKEPISDIIKNLKGSSSHYLNKESGMKSVLYWQNGYGVNTIRSTEIPEVTRYIINQKNHHATGCLSDSLEQV